MTRHDRVCVRDFAIFPNGKMDVAKRANELSENGKSILQEGKTYISHNPNLNSKTWNHTDERKKEVKDPYAEYGRFGVRRRRHHSQRRRQGGGQRPRGGKLVVIGARPLVGKSALMLFAAQNRQGRTGMINLLFDGRRMAFRKVG